MSCLNNFNSFKALPSLSSLNKIQSFSINLKQSKFNYSNSNGKDSFTIKCCRDEGANFIKLNASSLAIPIAVLLSTAGEPALAITGVNYEPDLKVVFIKIGIIAFWYFLIMPPIIMNWMRLRWYRRRLLEMFFQFMFVFMFFPGILLWAPFLNFRMFPRDPSMKNPWSKPEDLSRVKGGFLKYPWGTIEDYES